jgi:methionyl-tRNA formyltransferase
MMWIDEGIDSGNLILTEQTTFAGDEDLRDILVSVLEHGQSLCMRTIDHLAAGGRNRVPQSALGEGVTYYSKQWKLKQSRALVRNLKRFAGEINSPEIIAKRKNVRTVNI